MSCVQVACLIRVPTEVVKQRTQASPTSTTYRILLATVKQEVRSVSTHSGSLQHENIKIETVHRKSLETLGNNRLCVITNAYVIF